jgi:deoxyribonuclease-1
MLNRLFLILILILCSNGYTKTINNIKEIVISTHSSPIIDYTVARRHLFGNLHYRNKIVTDVYCQQDYDENHNVGKDRIPNPKFLNCEHTWPQSKFKNEKEEEVMRSDLHHLYPVASFANSARSNYPFGIVENIERICGKSYKGTIVGTQDIGFEPQDAHKGNAARAIFYFSIRYSMPIDQTQEFYLRQWHIKDPVDSFEKERNFKIEMIQGNLNPFIENPELVDSIKDF